MLIAERALPLSAALPVASDRTRRRSHITSFGGYSVKEAKKTQQWTVPSIRRYGTFEAATQMCDKHLGSADGYTFVGQAIVCGS